MSKRSIAPSDSGWAVLLSVVLTLMVMSVLLGLRSLLEDTGWWWQASAAAAAVLLVQALVRVARGPGWLVALAGLLAWAALSVVLFAPQTLSEYLLPTIQTTDALGAGIGAAFASIQTQGIPATADAGILQLIVMSSVLIAILIDTLAITFRAPAVAGVVVVALYALPFTIYQHTVDVALFALNAALFALLVLLAGYRRRADISVLPRREGNERRMPMWRRAVAGVLVGGVAIGVAIVVPESSVELGEDAFSGKGRDPDSFFYSAEIDPLIVLGEDLRRSTPIEVLSYVTDSDDALYLKLTNLSNLGNSPGGWRPDSTLTAFPLGYEEYIGLIAPIGLDPRVESTGVETNIAISGLRSAWLPVPFPSLELRGISPGWNQTPDSLTITSYEGNTQGENYIVSSIELRPSYEQLAASGPVLEPGFDRYLELPLDTSSIIAEQAQSVTAGASSRYDMAVRIQDYFTDGSFRYSLWTPVGSNFDGGNLAALQTFMTQQSGYCVHFASAMTLMARAAGIPARIAIGYAPGEATSEQVEGRVVRKVYTDQLHAWPELFFEGIGWLAFEPTPGGSALAPDYSLPAYASMEEGSASEQDSTSPQQQERADESVSAQEQQGVAGSASSSALWWICAAAALCAGILALSPLMMRRAHRRKRIAAISATAQPGTAAWHELLATILDYNVVSLGNESPRRIVRVLTSTTVLDATQLQQVLDAVEAEQFGAPDHQLSRAERQQLRTTLRALCAHIHERASVRQRFRARFIPASLSRSSPATRLIHRERVRN